MLKLGCTLPNLAKIRLHKLTSFKFYPFTETSEDLFETTLEDLIGGTSTVFACKAVMDESFKWNSTNLCKSIVGFEVN